MARIAVDCDGVLADFNAAALKVANRLFPDKFPLDFKIETWDWFEPYGDAIWAEINNTNGWWISLPAIRPQVTALDVFMHTTHGHEIWIVTSRTPGKGLPVARQTELWLQTMDINGYFNYLGVITVPHPSEKVKLYKAIEIGYSVDDKAETVEACDKLEGHRAFLLNQPWNKDAKVKNRLDNIGVMFDIIKQEGK